ncbi:MAG: 50S ribosomal protein L29 [Spirochaetales bacterium]|nr:50S ribosomal protein L29 [Spirochaetales bacterium]
MKDSFSDLSFAELLTKREELKKQCREARFNKVVGHLENPLILRTLRRQMARVNTIIHEYRLRIRGGMNE